MAVITSIEENKRTVSIYADGTLLCRVRRAHFEKCPLHEGEEIDPKAYAERLSSVQLNDAWEAALSSLEKSAQTEKTVSDALRRRGYAAPAIEAVVARLREYRLLDDAEYARRMAELQSKKPVGVYAFRRKLQARGISGDAAEEALQAFDDDQQRAACLEVARKLHKKYAALPPREGKARLSQALMRRGFGWDAVEGALDQLFD